MNSDIKNILMKEIQKKGKSSLTTTEIVDLFENNTSASFAIYNDYCKKMHKHDILDEIELINEEENKNITLTNDKLEEILKNYEDRLNYYDEWHEHLTNTLIEFKIIK